MHFNTNENKYSMDLKLFGDENIILSEDKKKIIRIEGMHFQEKGEELRGTMIFENATLEEDGSINMEKGLNGTYWSIIINGL